jgi:hypothetical protein
VSSYALARSHGGDAMLSVADPLNDLVRRWSLLAILDTGEVGGAHRAPVRYLALSQLGYSAQLTQTRADCIGSLGLAGSRAPVSAECRAFR